MLKKQMKKAVIALSKKIAKTTVNSTCCTLVYQNKIPDQVKKLRKF